MAVALGGLALVVAARGGEQAGQDADAAGDAEVLASGAPGSANADDPSWPGLTDQVGEFVGRTIRLLDFDEMSQPGATCAEGIAGEVPSSIEVSQGASSVLDSDRFARLEIEGAAAYGDLNGDDGDEAVVHAVCNYGANGTEDTVEVWGLDSGVPVIVASLSGAPASLDARFPPTVKDVAVEGSSLAITWTHHTEDDANCCPSLQTKVLYELVGDELTVIGEPVTSPAD